ncbi:hypothetical protein SS1G_12643 [Sclerotinia sclerotiorum 1980 UF-70]|uniref:BNI4 Bud neck involved n=2 Tax=Sclerotinia sclerotiorum (strain ATCC 18683 / 1980 / Ss-1) TaxID=665079 RepID=A7F4W8_SCLS1|nr:hypothetical protein SS1G_12643 [Sclerotinia sclerotiorum 1980 UF-70]APA10557.1 hypothetical protein sscle_06g053270 [Sclerotinia sclerotiorum 1980 UF-70]EDN97789.1 hypothetical protein SS1G_12643 [Sclerotinia sclerotiorum 1980 UF-70]
MAALVQTLPQQTTTVTMLQTRPSSASGTLQPSQNQAAYHQYPANPQQRNNFHGLNNNMAASNYRGHSSMAPMAPYAFTSTPGLSIGGQQPQNGSQSRPEQQRTSSAPIVPTLHGGSGNPSSRSRYPAALSVSTTSSSSSSELSHRSGTRDDSAITSTARVATRASRPNSTIITSYTQAPAPLGSPAKPAPDRYRRPAVRRAESSNSSQASGPSSSVSSMPNVMQFYGASTQATNTQAYNLQMPQSPNQPSATADDMQLNQRTTSEQAKRYRRRSIHTIDAHDNSNTSPSPGFLQQGSKQADNASGRIDQQPEQHPLRSSPVVMVRPAASHSRNDSTDSLKSTRSGHSNPNSSDKREATSASMASTSPAQSSTPTVANSNTSNGRDQAISKNDQPRLVNIPVRASSTDAAKRLSSPSPLSKPATMGIESSASKSKDSFASAVNAALQPTQSKPTSGQAATSPNAISPAAQHLAALNEKEGKKSKTSRLRRAFSFGSAAELRKASAETHVSRSGNDVLDRSKLRREKYQSEQEAEQDKIARRQEAAGIGSNIYSGQGNFFTGSTDNLSISSTASSASVMIRKMGKGMKKSTRSLVGLFRPKSVIGVPAADAAVPEASRAQVSMVNVEAEREKVNVNANAADAVSGGTGFPRLERNSLDTAAISSVATDRLGSANTESSGHRRSIVGGEKERAEVLAAVKKGILKRSGTGSGNSSPVILPVDGKAANFNLPQIPNVNNDSPNSSTPSTPNDDQVHKQAVNLGGEDYFMSALKFKGDSRSVPGTPSGTIKRNATFSPRIQFHDTWPSQEYDRRGEIATCNRLTPMLAQQIKEELNTFKMEMEVHENSKIYTHFF